MEAEKFVLYSPNEYLEAEKVNETKHEYLAGTMHAMSGASRRHNWIALSIAGALRRSIFGGPCEVTVSDVKFHIRTALGEYFYYPDVMVGCDLSDNHEFYLENPTIVFEVLSPSTELTDRREKLHAYQSVASLQHYVLVSQEEAKVEWLRRHEDGWQMLTLTSPEDRLEFFEGKVVLSLDEVYSGVEF